MNSPIHYLGFAILLAVAGILAIRGYYSYQEYLRGGGSLQQQTKGLKQEAIHHWRTTLRQLLWLARYSTWLLVAGLAFAAGFVMASAKPKTHYEFQAAGEGILWRYDSTTGRTWWTTPRANQWHSVTDD